MIADLRSKYGVGLWDVALRELLPLIVMLHRDPTSWLFAALNEWEHPASRELLTMADQYDAFVRANSKRGSRPKPYPRPFSSARTYGGRRKNKKRTFAEVDALFSPKEA